MTDRTKRKTINKDESTKEKFMTTDRIILRKKLDELVDVAPFFKKLTRIDVNNVPKRYGDDVTDAQKMLVEGAEIVIVYKICDIESVGDDEVVLKDDVKLTGEMPPKILADSKRLISCLITLQGFTEVADKTDDMMIGYFLDAWGSVYVESAQAWLGKYLKEELAKEGLKRTHLWSPGQHNFDLENQTALFEVLKPEEVGCVLTKNYMMKPVKSASGIWGIVDKDIKSVLLPCNFCPFGAKCPSSKVGCAEVL